MRILVSPGTTGIQRVFVGASVKYATPGTTYVRFEGKAVGVPLIMLEYDSATLEALRPLFAAFKDEDDRPVVYLWNLDEPDAEVVVWFEAKVSRDTAKITNPSVPREADWITLAESDFGQADAADLVKRFATTGCIAISVYDVTQDRQGKPAYTFVTRSLKQQRPPIEDI